MPSVLTSVTPTMFHFNIPKCARARSQKVPPDCMRASEAAVPKLNCLHLIMLKTSVLAYVDIGGTAQSLNHSGEKLTELLF